MVKKDLNKWPNSPCSTKRKFTIIKMTILPKLINQFHVIPIKIISFCLFLFDGTDSKLLLEEKYHDNIIWESIFWYMFSYNLAMLIQIYKQVVVLGIYPSGTPQAIGTCIF